jgi:hypothetical protein
VEPVAAGVYFAPEAHSAYANLGFEGSPVTQGGVARPDLKAYFTSRGACMGQASGEVVAAAFGCFNPKVVEQPRSITATCSLSMLARAPTRMILAAQRDVVRQGF